MTDKFHDKYRIPSARATWWDYGNQGAYFITICTQHRAQYFGDIGALSEIGKLVADEWIKTPSIRPDMHLELDEFVVMPNHFHAIIWIGAAPAVVQTPCMASLPANKFGPQRKNLASILRGFKSAVTKYAKIHNIEFGWQERYHDHIIRNEESYQRIRNYIINNPQNWATDQLNN